MPDGAKITDRRRVFGGEPMGSPSHKSGTQELRFEEDWSLHPAGDTPGPMMLPGVDYSKMAAGPIPRVRLICSTCESWQWHPGDSLNKARRELFMSGWTFYRGEDFCPGCQLDADAKAEAKRQAKELRTIPAYLDSTVTVEPLT